MQVMRAHHAERWRRWGRYGMYGICRIYLPYGWALAALVGIAANIIG